MTPSALTGAAVTDFPFVYIAVDVPCVSEGEVQAVIVAQSPRVPGRRRGEAEAEYGIGPGGVSIGLWGSDLADYDECTLCLPSLEDINDEALFDEWLDHCQDRIQVVLDAMLATYSRREQMWPEDSDNLDQAETWIGCNSYEQEVQIPSS